MRHAKKAPEGKIENNTTKDLPVSKGGIPDFHILLVVFDGFGHGPELGRGRGLTDGLGLIVLDGLGLDGLGRGLDGLGSGLDRLGRGLDRLGLGVWTVPIQLVGWKKKKKVKVRPYSKRTTTTKRQNKNKQTKKTFFRGTRRKRCEHML
jgi:hypothetical protein